MAGRRLAALALILAGCAAEAPPPPVVEPPPPPAPVGWRPIASIDGSGQVTSGYVQDSGLVTRGAVRHAWILLNFREGIEVPAAGGRARSVRVVAEYRCAQRQWRPLEGAWFARANAQEAVHAERTRGSFRPAAPGTLGGFFLDAACSL